MAHRTRNETGSSLMLVPAGMLVLMILASLCADSAVAFLARRELQNQAVAAVNDAVTAGIPVDALQHGDAARPDPARVETIVHQALDGYSVAGMTVDPSDVDVAVDDDKVSVVVDGEVPYIFARAVPGAGKSAKVKASAEAELRIR